MWQLDIHCYERFFFFTKMGSDVVPPASLEKAGGKITVRRFSLWPHVLLTVIIVAVSTATALLLLPYFLREKPQAPNPDPLSCSPTPYTGSQCLVELQEWQDCLPERRNVSAEILIPSDVNQELGESRAEQLFAGLQLVGPSEDCQREFRSFWCLLLFGGLCDGSGQMRLPSYELCNTLQTDTCSDLIQLAATVPEYAVIILNCNNFRLGVPPCENGSEARSNRDFNVSCSENFFYDNDALVCKPQCGVWTHLSPEADTALFVLNIIVNVASLGICSAILVLAIIQYKRIFTFPSVLIIYPTLTVLGTVILDLINNGLVNSLCASDDLLENISVGGPATSYCKFQSGVFLYSSLVISLFWLFQTAIYFWVVIYPVHYRSFNTTGKLKCIHALVVTVSFLLPVIPFIPAEFADGFGVSIFLPRRCTPLNLDLLFYGFVVPIDIVVIFGISLLIITVWSIGKVNKRLLKKPSQGGSKLKSTEVKLIVMIIHYLFLGFYTILTSNVTLMNEAAHQRVLVDHFTCEALGDETVDCSRDDFSQLQQDTFLHTFIYIGFNLYPSIFFIFLITRRMNNSNKYKAPIGPPTTSMTTT